MLRGKSIFQAAAAAILCSPAFYPAAIALAQSPAAKDTAEATVLNKVTITATRTAKTVFRTASPVVVVDSARIRATLPNGVAELLRESPGVDITGTGPNQGRPVIRGQRGQRILLLEDGVRLNNSRRQQDFGEIPALVGLDAIERVEVVRGPASVLYGTDAIGGVINLITARPTFGGTGNRINGRASYNYSTSDRQQRPSSAIFGQVGRFGFAASGAYRDAKPYDAPAGRFGDIRLTDETRVMDTGLRDESGVLQGGYGFGGDQSVSLKVSRYTAHDAGFGFVANAALGATDAPTIQIRYPDQTYQKLTLQYRGNALGLPFADRAEVTGYTSDNERSLTLGVFVPFGPGTPEGAGVQVSSRNFTDIRTVGFRAEAVKNVGRHILTYGMDFFRDRSDNSDSSVTTIIGFGPPISQLNDTATTPNAAFKSVGFFAQGDLSITSRLSTIVGARWQKVTAGTRPTARIVSPLTESSDATAVGAANILYQLTDRVNLIASFGRAFRSPNLIERFFQGATPEGAGYQLPNSSLKPERSFDVDLGVKVGTPRLYGEVFVFRNEVRDGIRIAPTGTRVGSVDAFQNVNVDKIRDQGAEVLVQARLARGFGVGATYSRYSSKNVLDPLNPVGDTYSSKIAASLGWQASSGRYSSEYSVRMNGERKDVALGNSPVGDVLPGFAVHSLRGSARVFKVGSVSNDISLVVNNLTNKLYAEFSNASFFRPEPKRSLAVSWRTSF